MPLEETENEIRARVQSPGKYDPASFRRTPFPPTKPERGVFAIYGCPKGEWKGGRCQVGVQIQSFRFSKEAGWTLAKAQAWLNAHDFKVVAEKIGEKISPDEITTGNILEKFYGAMVNSMREEYFKTGIHITDITRDCLRPAYYRANYDGMQFFGLWDTYNLWKGKMLHLTNVLPEGEVEVEWSGVKGRIDDYDPATGVIVEKKIIGRIPTEPLPHHLKQLQFQVVMMRENGKGVNQGFILYISPENKRAEAFEIPVTAVDLVDAKAEIVEKAEAVKTAFDDNTTPPRSTSWECAYCPYFTPCLVKEEPALANKIIKEASEHAAIKITFVSKCGKCGYIFASPNDPEEVEVKCPKCGGKCEMAVNPPKLNFNYLASIAADGDHHARVYLIDTSICGNNWRVTDEAIERAAKTIIGQALTIGHGAPQEAEIGRFVDYLKPDGQLYGLATITDEDAWARIKAGEWGPVSVEFIAKKITCSVCGADVTFKPDEHILDHTAHEVIEEFVFKDVALVETSAYPRAKIEELNGIHDVWSAASDHTSSLPPDTPWSYFSRKMTAELGARRIRVQPLKKVERVVKKGGTNVTEEELLNRIAELNNQLKRMTEERDFLKTGREIKELTKERDDFKAELKAMEKEQHEARVAALVDLRIKAGLVNETNRKAEIEQLGKLPDVALDQLTEDAKKVVPGESSKPQPKYHAGKDLNQFETTRQRLFGHTRDAMASDGGKIVG